MDVAKVRPLFELPVLELPVLALRSSARPQTTLTPRAAMTYEPRPTVRHGIRRPDPVAPTTVIAPAPVEQPVAPPSTEVVLAPKAHVIPAPAPLPVASPVQPLPIRTIPPPPSSPGLPTSVKGLLAGIAVITLAALQGQTLADAGIIPASYVEMLPRLCVDLIATTFFCLCVFQRRHQRADLVVAFMCFNVGLFAVMSTISTRQLDPGVGFGLFGLLSIIRLRSEPFTNVQLGYFFVMLVLALLSGIAGTPLISAIGLSALMIFVATMVDHPSRAYSVRTRDVTLDTVETDPTAVRDRLEREHGVRILDLEITQVDMVRDSTRATFRYMEPRSNV